MSPPLSSSPSMEEDLHPHHHHHHHHHRPPPHRPSPASASPSLAHQPTSADPHPSASAIIPTNATANSHSVQSLAQHHALSLSLPLHPPPSSVAAVAASATPRNGLPPNSAIHLSLPPPHKPLHNGPDQHPTAERASRDDCWSEGATNMLIDVWGDRYLELNRGNLKQKHWKDVADSVNARDDGLKPRKTDVQCKNRLDTLKKKYKLEKSKIVTGGGPSKWPFYDRLDELIGPSKKQKKPTPINVKSNDRPPTAEESDEQKPIVNANANAHLANNAIVTANNAIVATNNYANSNHHNNNITTTDTISKSKESPDMTDSCPYGLVNTENGKPSRKRKLFDNPFKELAHAILKFGEVYERIESAKQQQMMDLERQRMEFTKDLELQRMQLFMQTQVELAKLKHGKHGNTEHYL